MAEENANPAATINLTPVLAGLESLGGTASAINGNLSSLVGHAHALNGTLTSAEMKIGSATEALPHIADKVDTLSTNVSGLGKQLAALENIGPSLFDKLDQCSARFGRLEAMLRRISRGTHAPNLPPAESNPKAEERADEENKSRIRGGETTTEPARQLDWPPGLPYRRYFDPLGDEVSAMAAHCARQGITARRPGNAPT